MFYMHYKIGRTQITIESEDPEVNEPIMTRDFYEENDENPGAESKPKNFMKLLIVILVAVIVMQSVLMYSNQREGELVEQNAYLTCVLINMKEDHLLLKYNVFPEQVGLADYKNAWIENPCAETAEAYNAALEQLLNYLEDNTLREDPILEDVFEV